MFCTERKGRVDKHTDGSSRWEARAGGRVWSEDVVGEGNWGARAQPTLPRRLWEAAERRRESLP